MKKTWGIIVAAICLSAILPASAQAQSSAEKVVSFDAQIKINSDASLSVLETIVYDFGANSRHGIYRNIPYKYQARGGNFNLRISDISVTDGAGRPVQYEVSNQGQYKNIRIGNPDVLVSGQHTYIIRYTVGRAINFFNDHDELYWNVTGNDWEVPIEKVAATLILPQAVAPDTLQVACYFGVLGGTQECLDVVPFSSGIARDRVEFEHRRTLAPGEGFTVVFGFPKGLVTKPSTVDEILLTLQDNWILFLPFLVFALMFYLWYTRGRDPAGRGTVVVQYEPPEKLTPAEIGTVVDARAQAKDVSAEIIDLAVRGYLKIRRIEKKAFLGMGKTYDYELTQLKHADGNLSYFDREILKRLFSDKVVIEKKQATEASSVINQVTMSRLKGKFAQDFKEIQKQIYQSVTLKGYFVKNPNTIRSVYVAIGAVVAGAGIGIGASGKFGSFGIVSFLISGAIVIVFGIVMPKKTQKGAVLHEEILGLKEYLSVAEKDRIAFHNAPEKTPERFEKLLPYAMALGVEDKWAKQFEGIYTRQPSWYSDPSGTTFNALLLTNVLGDFRTSAQTSLAAPARGSAAAGGMSGFGGGGFSGGGFGGGGGGSW